MPNNLAGETSPYLLGHAENPVDWYPWTAEALDRAKDEDRPIFLSIGYSACHWCHVMEHESFENEEIAARLNEYFVSIKVDREERPDLDQLYMNAVQMLTGRGGWPMSVFLTPDLQPFFGGTYWPPTSKMGMPGFDDVIAGVHDVWVNRRSEAVQSANRLTEGLRAAIQLRPTEIGPPGDDALRAAEAALERIYDHGHGGFGGAPKFPHPMDLRLLLRLWHRQRRDGVLAMVTHTLAKMAGGGIYDHLGGGFHRYSVDERWLVPHFEKMLYDNALLANCYTEAFQATGDDDFARTARETLDYVLREMTGPEGGFHSTEDADSEGVEGKFYVWTPAQLKEILGDDAAKTVGYVYDVSEEGNFEGQNILNLPKTVQQCAKIFDRDADELAALLADSRTKLLAARNLRVRPALDDKVLVSWNGLMIDALALAAGAFGEPRYLTAATKAADFILKNLRDGDGRLLHCWRGGEAKLRAFLDDYACLAGGLVTLYEAGFEERFIDEAVALADTMLADFADSDGGSFFFTARDEPAPIARQKDIQDGAVPSGNGMAAIVLLRLGKLCGRDDYLAAAEQVLSASADFVRQHPTAAGQSLLALDMYLGPTWELVLLADEADPVTTAVVNEIQSRFLPNKLVAARTAGSRSDSTSAALEGIFSGKQSTGAPTLFACQNFTCGRPAVGTDAIRDELDRIAAAP